MKLSPLTLTQISAVLGLTAFVLLGSEAPTSEATEEAAPASTVLSNLPSPGLVTVTNLAENPAPAQPVKISDRLQEIVKLAQSGVGDDVMLAFIQNSPTPFNPAPEEVLYLTDIGVSDVIITALVNHNAVQPEMADSPATEPIEPQPETQQISPPQPIYNPEPQVVDTGAVPAGEYVPPPVVQYPPPPIVEYNNFYSSLSPYGSWVQVSDYGWCWQPTVAVVHHGWRPYCDRGRWLETDCGWYWHSDYSWGWAPFHYGRWFCHPSRGWCWKPDSAWAPAWVSWRYSDAFCGWAPLPPGARYHAGIGFTYYGAHVGVGFGFGLRSDAWNFVPAHRLHDPEVWRHRLLSRDVVNVYHRTTVVNHFDVDHHNNIVNHGIDRDRVPALARSEVRKVELRDLPARGGSGMRPDQLHQEGADLVVYRQPAPVAASQNAAPKPIGGRIDSRRGTEFSGNQRPALGASLPATGRPGGVSPATQQTSGPQTYRLPTSSTPGPRSEPTRPWSIPARNPGQTTGGSPIERFEPSQATIVSRETTAPNQIYRGTPASNPAWGQGTAGSYQVNSAGQRFYSAPTQASSPAAQVYRQQIPNPVAAAPAENYATRAPVQPSRPMPVESSPANRPAPQVRVPTYTPAPQAAYSAPQQAYSAPQPNRSVPQVTRPAPSYSAPAARSYTVERPASAPVSRPAPQSAPSSSSNERSGTRRQ